MDTNIFYAAGINVPIRLIKFINFGYLFQIPVTGTADGGNKGHRIPPLGDTTVQAVNLNFETSSINASSLRSSHQKKEKNDLY